MITHIKGRLVEKSPTSVVIECNGIGYIINISLNTFSQIPDDENLKLFTHLQVKEDSHTLYGFFTIKETSSSLTGFNIYSESWEIWEFFLTSVDMNSPFLCTFS